MSEEKRKSTLEDAHQYFDLAYLYSGGTPKLFVVFGLSGTGKSTIARALSEITTAEWIPSDIVRKSLVGISPNEHHYEPFEKGIYSREFTEKTYMKMMELVDSSLKRGRDVILDATFRERKYREFINHIKSAHIYWIWCTAPDSVVRERFMKRKESDDISDARWEIYLAQKEKFDLPDEIPEEILIKLNTEEEVNILVEEVISKIY